MGAASSHLLKYSSAVKINLCPLDELGFIGRTKSSPQTWKGSRLQQGVNFLEEHGEHWHEFGT